MRNGLYTIVLTDSNALNIIKALTQAVSEHEKFYSRRASDLRELLNDIKMQIVRQDKEQEK